MTTAATIHLCAKQACFVVEYSKDFAPRRAGEVAGYSPDEAQELLRDKAISTAISNIVQSRALKEVAGADWLLGEMMDNHMIARQMGNIQASNTILNSIGRHKRVDAFAADKIKVSTDSDVRDRLRAARVRNKEAGKKEPGEDGFISFM